jgi:uncharacterized protein YndB with AHSA1/START domain
MDTTASGLHVEVRRTFAAAPAAVYAAWTDPQALGAWFAPTGGMTTIVHALDLRVGGRYRIEMRPETGATHIVTGTYQELDAPHRLAFTWRWENAPVEEETLVAIDLHAASGGTELVLTHSRFASDTSRDGHATGWDGCLARLTATLARP